MSELALTRNQTVKYKDLYLRFALCLIASHILIVYGERLTAFEMMLLPQYYYAVLSSAAIALFIFSIIRWIVIKLDGKFAWNDLPLQRFGMQLFFGLLLPAIGVFLLVAFYFKVRGYDVMKTNYLRYDFQVVIMQLILINLYYVAYYFFEQLSHTRRILSDVLQNKAESGSDRKETFMVNKADANLIIHIDEIAYFFRDEDTNYLRTITGEDYFVNNSLDEVQQQLSTEKFFRANRQLILHRQSLKGFNLLEFGKLQADLTPALKGEAIISQKRARDFKVWLDK
ncbi:LytTR family transcriptional regulator DNA-binding domain-containing protein [Pedobacter jeongneungensis]|uniref:LytTR family transcriptional regulator DNA-binding domain-containing protein n=1 Tax=Pedobacter jeongneungensis TaxID=947309 RepID=UPI000468E346|nr:LytTR family transcriptional regulator DNA-binding domain-containing protein [Pedobacter jeongneungensis]